MHRLMKEVVIIKDKLYNFLICIILIVGTQIIYYHYKDVTEPYEIDYYDDYNGTYYTALTPDKTQLEVNDIYNQLINIKDFKFKINPNPCHGYPAGLLLVMIISSHPNNSQDRIAIRNTWGQSSDFVKVVFLLGETNDGAVSREVERESWLYRDIVLGNFVDAFRNMTYKHLMGLKWVAHHCAAARYVLKADDDVVVNSRKLWPLLVRGLSPWGAQRLMFCSLQLQINKSKWKITKEDTEADFPKHCLGAFILYSQDVVRLLLETTQNLPYFWIDDVQITGVAAARAGLEHTDMSSLYMDWERARLLLSEGMDAVGMFLVAQIESSPKTDLIIEIWNCIFEK